MYVLITNILWLYNWVATVHRHLLCPSPNTPSSSRIPTPTFFWRHYMTQCHSWPGDRYCTNPSDSHTPWPQSSWLRQRSNDESPSTSNGDSDADQRNPAAPAPEEEEKKKPSTQQKKNTKLPSKTTAKLSTSVKRIQKKLGEITLAPPPNSSAGSKRDNIYEWTWTILDPPGSVHEDSVFFLDITFSSNYPLKPHIRLLSTPESITSTSMVSKSSVWKF